MDPFTLETLRRLPLADASYRLLAFITQPDFLAALFDRHRGASYEKVISFPQFVYLIGDTLLEHQGSGHKGFGRAQDDGLLDASLKAVYGKLARLPLSLSRGFLAETTQALRAVGPTAPTLELPPSLSAFTVVAIDGKKIKHVAHRLKILRNVRGHVLAAKLLVALDMRSGLAVALEADPDGEVSDAPLVPGLLAQVRAQFAGPRLFVEDRQFCDLVQPGLIRAGGDHYLIRYNAKVSFQRDAAVPVRHGVDARGRAYQEEWGWLGAAKDKRRQYVRRITLERPDDEAVILLTDLLDADQYPAVDLLEVYLQRWGIERVFQRITEVFHLRRLIGSTPQAGVFQAAFCLLLYNVLVVVRGYISAAQQREAETISLENLFYDVQRQMVALHEVVPAEQIIEAFGQRRVAGQLRRELEELLSGQWEERWQKAGVSQRKGPAGPKVYVKGGHTSVYRLWQKARKSYGKTSSPQRK
jgi:hypothetical protein